MEYVSTDLRPDEYIDNSSILIAVLIELLVLHNAKDTYENLKSHIDKNMHLQIAHPNIDDYDIEQLLFEKHMDDEYYIEGPFSIDDNFDDFKKKVKEKEYSTINFRTDEAGFPFLRILAHKYFKNEIFPFEWRELIAEQNEIKIEDK